MISIVRLWEYVMQAATAGTSGYQDQSEFNNDIQSVQTDLITSLAPMYSRDVSVQELIAPFVIPDVLVTDGSGFVAKPVDLVQLVSVSIGDYPVWPRHPNEIAVSNYIPSRRPSVAENRYFYTLVDKGINLLPAQVHSLDTVYIRYPLPASIILTAVSTDDSDYLTPTVGADLEWPERAFNLIAYMMMERLGLEMKESLLLEYSKLGLQTEAGKLQ